jgi:SAM-dependent methyltransferase
MAEHTGSAFEVIVGCRSCSSPHLELVLALGRMPLSDALVPAGALRDQEATYPLTLVRCGGCSLVQILETVNPSVLYGREYPYYSSFSDALVEHARLNVDQICTRRGLAPGSHVVEVASNDGYLLQWFAEKGISVLGVDPAAGPVKAALARGIPTIEGFFDMDLARRMVAEGQQADVIVGNNVLAHVPDQNDLVAAMGHLLAPGGCIVMEFPYVRDLIDHCEFDTIYHEHHCYFSVGTAMRLFGRHGLDLTHVEHLEIHGGSLRVWFERGETPGPSVDAFLAAERDGGLEGPQYYADFAERVEEIRTDLVALLTELKSAGARIAAYGAAAKGAVLLNYCGIDERLIDYVVDRNTHKHGLEMPGVSLPIAPTDRLRSEPPDYLLLLAWNFKNEIMAQQSWFADQGGKYIIPVPSPVVV